MGDDFRLPAGSTFPSTSENSDRPRRRSIDTPALKLDTSSITSGTTVNVNAFPPPPKGTIHTQTKVNARPSPAKNALAISGAVVLPQNANNEDTTPVMQSMFPRFDPASRISRQDYAPNLVDVLPMASLKPAPYTPSLYSQPQSPPAAVIAADPWTASRILPRKYQSPPLHALGIDSSSLSNPEQLLDLWTIALGQESPEAMPKYTLGLKWCVSYNRQKVLLMSCSNSLKHNYESISLTSSSADFYAIKATGASMTITRKHPLNSQTGITIATTPHFETPTTTSPTVAVFFPSTAENQAVAEAKQVAMNSQLSQKDAMALQAKTIESTRRAEAGALLWDSDSSSYYFTLPDAKERLETNIRTPFPIEHIPGESIRFMDRSSQPILTLNLTDCSLVIETTKINSLSTSSHTLDILLSGILTLVLYLHRIDGVFYEPRMVAPYFAPPPKSIRGGKVISSPRSSTPKPKRNQASSQLVVPWLSRLNPLAARKQPPHPVNPVYFLDHNNSDLTFDKDLERGSEDGSIIMPRHRIPPMTAPPIAPSGIAPELRGSNTGVDLSKFQAFDLKDPDLGSGTKAALRILYWAFSVIVWILGVITGVLAAGVVALGSCLGGGNGSREG